VSADEKRTLVFSMYTVVWWRSKLWSFLVTGTAGRHELKIWSTQSWSCLQTVTLLVPPTGVSSPGSTVTTHDSYLQLAVDLSATYLVLCDISRKVTLIHYYFTDTVVAVECICDWRISVELFAGVSNKTSHYTHARGPLHHT